MAAAPCDTRLGPLKDPRSLDRGPALRGHGWGRVRQEGGASNTATCAAATSSSTSSNSSSSLNWKTGFLTDTTASSGGAGWGRPSTEVDSGGGGWGTKSVGGWPTVVKSENKGTGWTTPGDRDRDTDDDDDDDVTMDERSPSPRPGYRRLFAFNAKISQQPCSCLIKLFGSNEDTKSIQISKDENYTVWEVEEAVSRSKNARFKFAGMFNNPVDGETFVGGRSGGAWKGAEHELVEVLSRNGKTVMLPCYSTKANARHAAAARAIDCLSFRSTDGEETYGMCIDQPYMDPAEAPSMPVAATAGTTGRNISPEPPKAQLQQYFQDRFLDFESIGKYFYSDFYHCDDRHRLHTSVFINPMNGTERFGCGRYVGNGKSPSYETTEEDVDGSGALVEVVWYKRKKDAEHAAAARALDCLRLRESDPSLHPQLCSETPYLNPDEAPLLPLRFQPELEAWLSEEPVPVVSHRRVRPLPMETEAEVAHRQEYRMSRMS